MARQKQPLPTVDDGNNPYGIVCPTCAAKPGERCTSRSRVKPTVYHYPHENRILRAQSGIDFQIRQMEVRFAIERRRANPKGDIQ